MNFVKKILRIGMRNCTSARLVSLLVAFIIAWVLSTLMMIAVLVMRFDPLASSGGGLVFRMLLTERYALNPAYPYQYTTHPSVLLTIVYLMVVAQVMFVLVYTVLRMRLVLLRLRTPAVEGIAINPSAQLHAYPGKKAKFLVVIIFLITLLLPPISNVLQVYLHAFRENRWLNLQPTGHGLPPSYDPLWGSYLTDVDLFLCSALWLVIARLIVNHGPVRYIKAVRSVLAGKCPRCRYCIDSPTDLGVCPECGTDISSLRASLRT